MKIEAIPQSTREAAKNYRPYIPTPTELEHYKALAEELFTLTDNPQFAFRCALLGSPTNDRVGFKWEQLNPLNDPPIGFEPYNNMSLTPETVVISMGERSKLLRSVVTGDFPQSPQEPDILGNRSVHVYGIREIHAKPLPSRVDIQRFVMVFPDASVYPIENVKGKPMAYELIRQFDPNTLSRAHGPVLTRILAEVKQLYNEIMPEG